MYTKLFFPLLCAVSLPLLAQLPQKQKIGDFIESTSYNDGKRGSERRLQYRPEGDDFVSVNGRNRYTRALYGGHTAFRLETSDYPVFAAYDKNHSQNISFRLVIKNEITFLDSIRGTCESRYTAGRRTYRLASPEWGKGELCMTALALYDEDGAIWKIEAFNMPIDAVLLASQVKIRAARLNRNGDMGADPADSFEAPEDPSYTHCCGFTVKKEQEEFYLIMRDLCLGILKPEEGRKLFEATEQHRAELASRIRFETPDPFFNTLGGALAAAADGIWDGEVWLHGAVGWRMPLSGWRAAYTGDALGWHDRARTHFDAYAASQVVDVPNTLPHPAQDSVLNLARSEKRWGTPQYSNGYICRNPRRNDQMHHYDMNLCYIDELMWHFNWTGDLAYARRMWPVITRHLAWEKRNYDPDNDGLYDAYACIWASDALYYNSGAVTHSSAYNYRANLMAARMAKLIGEDPAPYQAEADKILEAINNRLWIGDKGHWAEFQDFMGHQRLHESAGVWTIYHALDSEVADPFQAYQATRYVDTQIPHIPVSARELQDGYRYATLSTTNWLPYSWSINNVAFAEVMHTALAYFQAGRAEEGYLLLKSSILDGMYFGNSPGNFGQVSFYDAARGECYRDFGDPIGVASRVLIQGLYGVLPDALHGKLTIRPGFPSSWRRQEEKISLRTPDLSYCFEPGSSKDVYTVQQRLAKPLEVTLQVRAYRENIVSVKVNGRPASWRQADVASGEPEIVVVAPAMAETVIEIAWAGDGIGTIPSPKRFVIGAPDPRNLAGKQYVPGYRLNISTAANAEVVKLYDPQGILLAPKTDKRTVKGTLADKPGHHTFFVCLKQGQMQWWQPVNININGKQPPLQEAFTRVLPAACQPVPMEACFNASVTDIFTNEYLSPRSPYTTLQLPKQGIGEWCHPNLSAEIDDSGLRARVRNGLLETNLGVSFRTPAQGRNIAFTSLWDNYPDSLTVPLTGKASHAYLLMAGSTNHMQCHIDNGVVRVYYTDGSCDMLPLVNPDNWCPIEQDFFVDGQAFRLNTPRPYRLHLKSGLVSNNLEKDLNITGVYGREIEGGAAVLLDMPLNPCKTLSHLVLETLSNDVVIGLMGITLQM